MAYTLNTGHALYGNLVELFGVQSGALVSHKTARTFTKHADATYGTGTYGEHFAALAGGYTAKGASFSPYLTMNTSTKPNYTVVAVVNSSGAVQGGTTSLFLSRTAGGDSIRTGGKDSAGNAVGYRVTGATMGTGARMITYCRIGETAAKLYNNTTLDVNSTGLGSDYNSPDARADYLCGWDGQNSMTMSLVWLAVFDKELSQAEVTDLYNSLGADNAFGLVQAAGNAAPTFPGPNIGNLSGTVGTALTSNNVASKFSDTDALTFSAVGTWPPGVTVSSAGVISGTPTTAGTYASLKVRATDTAAQTVDSDTFSFTINASAHLVTVASSQQVNTASAAAIQQSGNGTITLPALKDWGTGNLKASETGVTIIINNATTGVLVALLTGQTANASGVLPTLTGLVSGTAYRVTTILADGSEGTWKYTAS